MPNASPYYIYHDRSRSEVARSVAVPAVIQDMAMLLRWMSSLPKTGRYKVYDGGHFNRLVVTVQHIDYDTRRSHLPRKT